MINKIIDMRTIGKGLENDGQYWFDKDRQFLLDWFLNGRGISEIAVRLKRSEPAIVQQLIREGLFHNETKRRNRGKNHSAKCLCRKCSEYEHCRRSPMNCPMICTLEGGTKHV